MNDKGSVTALVTAFSRAYHSMRKTDRIFDDFLAAKLFNENERAFLEKNMAESLKFLDPELAATCGSQEEALETVMRIQNGAVTLSRSRYTEDRLEEAITQGLKQYVILGAGMDTFAFRKPELLKKIDVYEVDHPSSQAAMLQKINELGWKVPKGLHFVPQDFSVESLGDALKRSDYDPGRLTFFSWLGVVFYLERQTVFDMLGTFKDISAPGSIIVFDYFDVDAFDPEKAGKRIKKMQEIVSIAGEPMKTGLDPIKLEAELDALGLKLLENLGPEDIEERYFRGRDDDFHAYEHVHFAKVQVK